MLLAALTEYRKDLNKWSRKKSDPKPRIPDYVGQCLYLINEKLSRRPNFGSYTYREDMVGDGIENCCAAVDNFDPAKSANPFGYFTLIAWRAFVRRIDKEKKQTYVKIKNFENLHLLDESGEFRDRTGRPDVDGPGARRTLGNEFTDEFVRKYEKRMKGKERSSRKKRELKTEPRIS